MVSILKNLEQEKDHLEKIIKVVSAGGKFMKIAISKKVTLD